MKAVWVLVAASVALWAGADVSQARVHHHKKKKAAAASSSSSSSSSADVAGTVTTAQQPILPQAAGQARPPSVIANSTTTTQYDPAKGFPDHNGALSAMLVVIPQGELQEFERPAGAGRHLDRVARAEPGARLAIKIVFVGVKPDWNANANVTYDLQIIGPDGKIYGRSNYKNLPALQGRIVTADDSGMYDNRPKVVIMQFEPQDQVGMYKIRAVLHDNVANLDLPLEAGIELLNPGAVTAAKGPPAAPPAPAPSPAPMAPVPAPMPATPVPATPVPAAAASAASSSSADVTMAPIPDGPAPSKKKSN